MARISTHPVQVFLALGMAVGLSAAATTPTTIAQLVALRRGRLAALTD